MTYGKIAIAKQQPTKKTTLRMNSTDIRDGFNRSVKVNFQNKVSSVAGIIPAIHNLRVAGFFDCVLGPLAQSIEDKRTPALIRHVSTLCTWFSRETPNKKRPPRRSFSLRQS